MKQMKLDFAGELDAMLTTLQQASREEKEHAVCARMLHLHTQESQCYDLILFVAQLPNFI